MPFFYYFDPTVIILIPGIIIALWASINVNTTFDKYNRVPSRNGLTGAQVAERVLNHHGIYNVRIERVSGNLSDHYDPRANVIRLSDSTYNSTSIAAAGVAAHEAGHAVQHAKGYLPIKIRTAIVPITNIGSKLAMPLILIGLLLSYSAAEYIGIAYAGVVCFSLCALFQLVTLPTEYNASARAMKALESNGRLTGEELKGSRRVLSAAALTYVAALAVSLMQLFRLLLLVRGSDRRR